jgi:type III secretion system TyeA family effector delivery regulator
MSREPETPRRHSLRMTAVHSTRASTGSHAAGAQNTRPAQPYGKVRSRSIVLQHGGAARSTMRPSEAEKLTLPNVRQTDLKSLRVTYETTLRATPAQTILASAEAKGLAPEAVRRHAKKITRELSRVGKGGLSARAGSRRASAFRAESPWDSEFDWDGESGEDGDSPPDGETSSQLEYFAYQLALTAAEDDEQSLAAILTPVESFAHTPQQLVELIREVLAKSEHDTEAFDRFVDNVLEGAEFKSDAKEAFADQIRKHRNDDEKLMELFVEAQGLPSFAGPEGMRAKERLVESLRDKIRENQAEASGKGQRADKALSAMVAFNTALVAAASSDPNAFEQMYMELVKVQRTFPATLKLLAIHFLSTLKTTIERLLEAISADMNAATPTRDHDDLLRLWATATLISQMTMGLTLEASLQMLGALMKTLPEQRIPLDIVKSLTGLLDIIDSANASSTHFDRLAQSVGVAPGAPTAVFLNGMLAIMRQLPEKAFTDGKARRGIQSAAEDAASYAADREDELNEQEQEKAKAKAAEAGQDTLEKLGGKA